MEIKEIKDKLEITTVLAHYNLKPNANNHIKCPFHKDDKPSLRIYPETNTYTCFGCDKTGDVIQFIQDIENCTWYAERSRSETQSIKKGKRVNWNCRSKTNQNNNRSTRTNQLFRAFP